MNELQENFQVLDESRIEVDSAKKALLYGKAFTFLARNPEEMSRMNAGKGVHCFTV